MSRASRRSDRSWSRSWNVKISSTRQVGPWKPKSRPDEWYTDVAVKEELLELMSRYGVDEDMITAEAIALRSRELAQVDLMLASAEKRRNEMLREIGLYRELLSTKLGDSTKVVEGEAYDIALAPSNN